MISSMKLTAALSLVGAPLVAAAEPSYYKQFYTSAVTCPDLKIYDGRGWFHYVHVQSVDTPDVHRLIYGNTLIDKPDIETLTGYDTASAMDYVADFSYPNPIPPTMVIGWNSEERMGAVGIYQGLKRTSFAQWSQIQLLSAPEELNYQTNFGKSVVLDRSDYHTFAVGCPGCNSTSPSGGQVYLYKTREGKQWSQSQVLQFASPTSAYTRLGNDLQYHDNVLLASVNVTTHGSEIGYAAFLRGPGPKDPFEIQQVFTVDHGFISGSTVYDETIILANKNAPAGSLSNAGAVYILYPSTERFGLKPAGKPRPTQWSVQQVLQAPAPAANDLYGNAISMDRDTLVVTSFTSDSAYVYKREELHGKWSQQQVITVNDPRVATVAGSKIGIGRSSSLTFYSLDHNWDCLIVTLEDHFGDGWDIAELTVRAPDGTQDFYALSCEQDANPLKFRYCPNLQSDEGIYSFSISNALKSKFYWEIQYNVFEESTGLWHKGNWETKMDFHWDAQERSFTSRKLDRVYKNTTTCEPCKTRPTEKPTPSLRRVLKGGDDHTHAPTVSPAPTLDVANTINWRYLTLFATSPWFDNEYHGTEYYISDAQGHRLITSGTICPGETTRSCWIDLPDGDYTLRIGGALNANNANNEYTFCKQVNQQEALTQMMFRIQDDDCSIATFAAQDAVCDVLLGITHSYYLVLNFNLLISGASITTVTSAERKVFAEAFASIFPSVSSSDVSLISAVPSGNSVLVNANIRISSAVGYNLLDFDEETLFESYIKSHIEDQQTASSLVAALSSGSVASAFTQSNQIEFLNFKVVDSVHTLPLDELNPEVVSFADAETESVDASSSKASLLSPLLAALSEFGYLMAGVGIILIVGLYTFNRSSQSDPHLPTPIPTESTHQQEAVSSSRRVILGDNVASPTQLSPHDLKELMQMEKDYLHTIQQN